MARLCAAPDFHDPDPVEQLSNLALSDLETCVSIEPEPRRVAAFARTFLQQPAMFIENVGQHVWEVIQP